MRHGCTAAAAAVVIAGFALPAVAVAACNVRNPTACTSDSQPQAAAQSQQPPAARPLQLKRFMKLGPARRGASRSARRRVAEKPTGAPAPQPEKTTRTLAEVTASLEPKAVSTVSITAPAVAVAPAITDGSAGFAAATEPWSGISAFASDEPAPPARGVIIARFDEINEIDLAADTEAMTEAHAAKSDRIGVSLTSPANAAAPATAAAAQASEREPSWLSWLYGKLIDGILAVVLAVRSFFV